MRRSKVTLAVPQVPIPAAIIKTIIKIQTTAPDELDKKTFPRRIIQVLTKL